MNTEKLMNYDWILVEGQPVQVEGINFNQVYYRNEEGKLFGSFFFNYMPITKEVLELNNITESQCSYDEDDGWILDITNGTHYSWHIEVSGLQWVHELQQAFRLCKVDDVANNFKVKQVNGLQ